MYFDEAAFYALRHEKHLGSHSRTGLGFAQSRQKQHPQTCYPKIYKSCVGGPYNKSLKPLSWLEGSGVIGKELPKCLRRSRGSFW